MRNDQIVTDCRVPDHAGKTWSKFSISPGNFNVTDHRVLLLETICVSPVVFLVFAALETLAPERSGGEQGGSYAAKTLENKGREHVGKRSTL